MNYIGSKLSLLDFIESSMQNLLERNNDIRPIRDLVVGDLFAGTGIVGYYFKSKGCKIISNDLQYYSYVLNKNIMENNHPLLFEGLFYIMPNLENTDVFFRERAVLDYLEGLNGIEGFIYKNYSENGEGERLYFSEENGKKCDSIRVTIEEWYTNSLINHSEYYFLKSSLIESIDKVANTASVYGAFLKNIKKTAQNTLRMIPYLSIINNNKENNVYHSNINDLINLVEGDILYLDPPYNHRQYSSNYHLLETIAKYDNPEITGKTGLRDYSNQKSLYCSKNKAVEEFELLIKNSNFSYIMLSYNDEGIIPIAEIERIFNNKGTYIRYEKEYKRFRADSDTNRNHVKDSTIEYLHCCIVEGN